MSKLLKIKKWISLNDAAQRLSLTLLEEVSYKDVLQACLDSDLQLSCLMRKGAGRQVYCKGDGLGVSFGQIQSLDGVFPLILNGRLRSRILDYILDESVCYGLGMFSGWSVLNDDGDEIKIFELCENKQIDDPGNYIPKLYLPELERFVIRPRDLFEFEKLLQDETNEVVSQQAPTQDSTRINPREYLKTIGAMAIIANMATREKSFSHGNAISANKFKKRAETLGLEGISNLDKDITSALALKEIRSILIKLKQ